MFTTLRPPHLPVWPREHPLVIALAIPGGGKKGKVLAQCPPIMFKAPTHHPPCSRGTPGYPHRVALEQQVAGAALPAGWQMLTEGADPSWLRAPGELLFAALCLVALNMFPLLFQQQGCGQTRVKPPRERTEETWGMSRGTSRL